MPVAKLEFTVQGESWVLEFAELEGSVTVDEILPVLARGVLCTIEDSTELEATINLKGKLYKTSTIPCGRRIFVNPQGREVRLIE